MFLVYFRLREYSQGRKGKLSNKLSFREVEILSLMAHGLKDREVAAGLFVSVVGVKSHCTNIYKKLHAANRTDAVVKAHQQRYINIMERK